MPKTTLLLALLLISSHSLANPKLDTYAEKDKSEKPKNLTIYNHYDFLAQLNTSLKSSLQKSSFKGLRNVFTFQKNRQVIINVIHNPYIGYQGLVDNIAQSASRVNGVNLQNAMTLQILNNYCTQGHFYRIQAKGLSKQISVQYETTDGKRVAVHKLSRKLCQ